MQKQEQSKKAKMRNANFKITEDQYKHFKILAASNQMGVMELYRRAAIEFMERNPLQQIAA